MTSLNALVEHIQEFCQEVRSLEEQFGLKIMVDLQEETIMLVNNDTEKPIAWLGVSEIKYDTDYADVDNEELSKVVEPVVFEADFS